MRVFNVPEHLSDQYKGSGHAIAASKDGELVEITYMRDALPAFDPDQSLDDQFSNPELFPLIERLKTLGELHFGMLSCREFCEL